MGSDEYHPIGHKGTNLSTSGGIGYTVIDALDTMMIMGLDKEVSRAREWIKTKLSFEREGEFSTFEVHLRRFFFFETDTNTTNRRQSVS